MTPGHCTGLYWGEGIKKASEYYLPKPVLTNPMLFLNWHSLSISQQPSHFFWQDFTFHRKHLFFFLSVFYLSFNWFPASFKKTDCVQTIFILLLVGSGPFTCLRIFCFPRVPPFAHHCFTPISTTAIWPVFQLGNAGCFHWFIPSVQLVSSPFSNQSSLILSFRPIPIFIRISIVQLAFPFISLAFLCLPTDSCLAQSGSTFLDR